jgi:hypothetical protein
MSCLIDITWLDDYGRVTTKRYESNVATAALAFTAATAMVAAMLPISDAGVVKVNVIFGSVADAAAATAGANADTGATLHCTLDNGKGYGLKIPMIKATKVGSGGSIDILDADIVTFTTLFLTGGAFRMSEGNFVTDVRSGELDK